MKTLKKIFISLMVALLTAGITQAQFRQENANVLKIQTRIDKDGKRLPPDIIVAGMDKLSEKIGWFGQTTIAKPVIEKEWVEKEYDINKEYDMSAFIVFFYLPFDWLEISAGAGIDLPKEFYGPVGGFLINKYGFSFSAAGTFPVYCGYHDMIKGYDPNSWYKVFLTYKVKDWDLGISSSRFYGTGLIAEYRPPKKSKISGIMENFQILMGRDLEFKRNSVTLSLGLVLPS